MTAFRLCSVDSRYPVAMKPMNRAAVLVLGALAAACNTGVYTRDGVTDGDTFYLAEYALYEPDPVLGAWVTYSLDLAACQLTIGGDNPARNTSFQCELSARQELADDWREKRVDNADLADRYLDGLVTIADAGFLAEYVADVYRRRSWELPYGLDIAAYRQWRRETGFKHKPARRIIGSWNYKDPQPG